MIQNYSVYTPAFIALHNTEYKGKGTILSKFRESGKCLLSLSISSCLGSFLAKVGAQSLIVLSLCNGMYNATTGAT